MNKITISDFIIAVFDLVEAEGKAFKDNANSFLEIQQQNIRKNIIKSLWTASFIFITLLSTISAIVFFIFGCYKLLTIYVSSILAPFLVTAILIVIALIFGYFATKKSNYEDK